MASSAADPGIERSLPYRVGTAVATAPMRLFTRTDWQGLEHLPTSGPCLVAANHISYADPFAVTHVLRRAGHAPFFLAKDSIFELPIVGPWFRAAGQIPVHRGTGQAALAYADAEAALRAGRTIVIMPEGTFTQDPDGWPMRAKSGVVRLAVATGAPVIPLGQWGAQELLPVHARVPRLWPRPTMRMRFGPPVPLDDLRDGVIDHDTLVAASERVMAAITTQVAALRGLTPPPGRWDPAVGQRVPPAVRQPHEPMSKERP